MWCLLWGFLSLWSEFYRRNKTLTRKPNPLLPFSLPSFFSKIFLFLSFFNDSQEICVAEQIPMKEFKTDFVSSASCSDRKIRVKHETLMQDYQELIKETELKRRRLEMIKRRKSILMAEIRFLKRRCKHLKEDQILEETSLKMMKSSESGDLSEQFGPKTSVECVDLTQKNTICDEKEELVAKNAMYDLEKNTNRNSISVPEVNGDENSLVNSKVSSFDLNKISIEEEEEEIEPKMTKIDDRNDEIKMSIYRKVKRKVSWQEPVAKSLRFSFDL